MFITNKYTFYYYNIISRAKARVLDANIYVERHHIIPKSLGGGNELSNIVCLTAKEHLICHLLLVRMTTGLQKSKMANAAWRMMFSCKNHKREKVTSRSYEMIRKEVALSTSQRSKHYKHSEESKKKIAESKLGKPRNWTSEWREKISQSHTGMKKKPCSSETKEKLSGKMKGRKRGPMTEESRMKLSESKKGKKIFKDPVTGKRTYQTLP